MKKIIKETIKCDKYNINISTNSFLEPYLHHFVELQYPILVGPKHMATGLVTISRRSTTTGAVISNEITYLQISRVNKNGSLSKIKRFVKYKPNTDIIDRKGYDNFKETFIMCPEYKSYFDMQVYIGELLYDEYRDYLPEHLYINHISIKTYLDIKIKRQHLKEEKRLLAHNRMMQVYSEFLGKDPIIGMDLSIRPLNDNHHTKFSQEELSEQYYKVIKIKNKIKEAQQYELDFTDFKSLREEKLKLDLMERGLYNNKTKINHLI